MKSKHVIGENSSYHSSSNPGQNALSAHRRRWAAAESPPARRPCRMAYRDHLRNIRSAELAFWEATGGDVLHAGVARLFELPTAGTPRRSSKW